MNYHIENTKPMVFGFLYSLVDGLKLSTAFSYVDNLYVNNNYITFLDYILIFFYFQNALYVFILNKVMRIPLHRCDRFSSEE